jgi:hypothetical protein
VRTILFFPLAAALSLSCLIGCGSKGVPIPKTVPAQGTVTYQGKPVDGANVVFNPEGEGRAASAVTDASGNFTAKTSITGDTIVVGAIPGTYRVSITKIEKPAAKTPQEMMASRTSGAEPAEKHLIPERYSQATSSGITVVVPPEGKRDIKFELTD